MPTAYCDEKCRKTAANERVKEDVRTSSKIIHYVGRIDAPDIEERIAYYRARALCRIALFEGSPWTKGGSMGLWLTAALRVENAEMLLRYATHDTAPASIRAAAPEVCRELVTAAERLRDLAISALANLPCEPAELPVPEVPAGKIAGYISSSKHA